MLLYLWTLHLLSRALNFWQIKCDQVPCLRNMTFSLHTAHDFYPFSCQNGKVQIIFPNFCCEVTFQLLSPTSSSKSVEPFSPFPLHKVNEATAKGWKRPLACSTDDKNDMEKSNACNVAASYCKDYLNVESLWLFSFRILIIGAWSGTRFLSGVWQLFLL